MSFGFRVSSFQFRVWRSPVGFNSLCNLRVLCVSVVSLLKRCPPQRHRGHGGCTEKTSRRNSAHTKQPIQPRRANPKLRTRNSKLKTSRPETLPVFTRVNECLDHL